jgi:chromosome segregation ATPase
MVAESSILMDLKVEIAMLKQEVTFINKLFDKMDTVINKIDSQHDILVDKTTKIESNLSFTKEELTELYVSLEKSEKELRERINSIEKLISQEIKTLDTVIDKRISNIENKTVNLVETKWITVGILAAITWLISNQDLIIKIFK